MREDIKVWLTFLSEYNGVTVITYNAWASNETLELFTESAGGRINKPPAKRTTR
jgi:hypothetical protein